MTIDVEIFVDGGIGILGNIDASLGQHVFDIVSSSEFKRSTIASRQQIMMTTYRGLATDKPYAAITDDGTLPIDHLRARDTARHPIWPA